MAMKAQDTEVGKWLLAHDAGPLVDEFFYQGYRDKADLSKEVIDRIVPKKYPGLASRLARLLEDERKPASHPPIPALPAGTQLDLSQAEIEAPGGPAFTLPKQLSVEASNTAVISPLDLKNEDWMIVASNSRLLYAYTMKNFDGIVPPQARLPVLDWVIPARRDFVRAEQLEAAVSAAVTYTEETASYVRSGFDKESASAGYLFCSGSFEREHKERRARSSHDKTLQMIGRWYYPRATLILDICTRVSPNFVTAVKEALASQNPAEALKTVFDEKHYGAAIPQDITLGGQLYFTHRESRSGEVDEKSVEDVVTAAVSIKTGKGEGSAGAAVGSGSGEKFSAQSISESTQFQVLGGDATLASSPQTWPNTVKDPRQWAVIGRQGLRSTVELLDPDLRNQVLEVWSRVGIVPAILPVENLPAEKRSTHAETAGFLLGSREPGNGQRGSIVLVCGGSSDPKLTDDDAVGGAACVHMAQKHDVWFDSNSICLPVPAESFYHTETIDTGTFGHAPTRLAFAPTRLGFGRWARIEADSGPRQAASDGFLFVAIHAERGERGVVRGSISGAPMASASVHQFTEHWNWISDASFCLPVPRGSKYSVALESSVGSPKVSTWWLPCTSLAWRFEAPVTRSCGTILVAKTDGILHGFIAAKADGNRGLLKLYADEEASSAPTQLPCASASVHKYSKNDRWITDASAMLPVPAGSQYKAVYAPTRGQPNVQAFWTAIVPVA